MRRLAFFVFVFMIFCFAFPSEINLSKWKLVQDSSLITYTFGDISIPGGGYLIICRGNKTQAEFESFWGVSLGANVIFLDSLSPVIPQNNGRETYSLYDSLGILQDTTTPRSSNSDKCMQRDSSSAFTFTLFPTSSATPGLFTNKGSGAGMIITEFADSEGIGNYLYNFIELYNDTVCVSGAERREKEEAKNIEFYAVLKNRDIHLFCEANLLGEGNVFVYDLSGRKILSRNIYFKDSRTVIEDAGLKPGIYFVCCNLSKHILKTKISSI